jgi:hypothetical protein
MIKLDFSTYFRVVTKCVSLWGCLKTLVKLVASILCCYAVKVVILFVTAVKQYHLSRVQTPKQLDRLFCHICYPWICCVQDKLGKCKLKMQVLLISFINLLIDLH